MITRRSQFGPTLRRLGRSRYLWISNFDPVLERFRKLRINMERNLKEIHFADLTFAMRLVCAVALILAWWGSALAQSNAGQPPGSKTGMEGTAQRREAPVGHRQPASKDLPADVLQREREAPAQKKLDKGLTICRGC